MLQAVHSVGLIYIEQIRTWSVKSLYYYHDYVVMFCPICRSHVSVTSALKENATNLPELVPKQMVAFLSINGLQYIVILLIAPGAGMVSFKVWCISWCLFRQSLSSLTFSLENFFMGCIQEHKNITWTFLNRKRTSRNTQEYNITGSETERATT